MGEGTYAGWYFDSKSKTIINNLQNTLGIPNLTPKDKLHVTLLFSRKFLPNYKPLGKVNIKVQISDFKVFETEDKKYVLVAVLKGVGDKNPLIERHKELMVKHEATFDYEVYTPHVTLSYDVGPGFNFEKLKSLEVEKIIGQFLNLNEEYSEGLDLNWSVESSSDFNPQESKEFPGFYRIPGYSKHLASKEGKILTKKTGNSTLGGIAGTYRKVKVYKDGSDTPELQYAHILVCRAFYGIPDSGMVALHLDNDCTNNDYKNLKWGTQSENIQQMWDDGSRESSESLPPSAGW